jgi:hypothetical protein
MRSQASGEARSRLLEFKLQLVGGKLKLELQQVPERANAARVNFALLSGG